MITVEENKGIDTLLDHVEGMEFDKGYLSPYFATDLSKLVAEYEDVHIFICNKKISTVRELVPALEAAMRTGKPLLIIAEDIEGEALTALVINRLKNVLNVAAVKAPGLRRASQVVPRGHRRPHRRDRDHGRAGDAPGERHRRALRPR